MAVTKRDLIDEVADRANLTNKASRDAVQALIEAVVSALKRGERVVVTGFGTFSVRQRAARTGRNPQTGQPIQIPATRTPGFTAGKALKRAVR